MFADPIGANARSYQILTDIRLHLYDLLRNKNSDSVKLTFQVFRPSSPVKNLDSHSGMTKWGFLAQCLPDLAPISF
jgi:hypothetical protein